MTGRRWVAAFLLAAVAPVGCGTLTPTSDRRAGRTTASRDAAGWPALRSADSAPRQNLGRAYAAPTAGVVPVAYTEPAPPTDGAFLDLPTALRVANGENPLIALAREQVTEALARQTGARALLLPSLAVGGNVHLHNGPLQRATGGLFDVTAQSFYFGGGAGAVGAGTPAVPGVRLFSPLADAVYEPVAAREIVSSRRADAVAVDNDTLLRVATAYLDLAAAEARLDVMRTGADDLAEVVRLTAAYAAAGQNRAGDARRAAANADFHRRQSEETAGDVRVASARLAGLLGLDPAVPLHAHDRTPQPVRLVDENADLESLVGQGLMARPEVAARSADVREAEARLRQERVRPWLPTVSVGFSGGGFGGGSNLNPQNTNTYRGRTDFDAAAVWTVQNFGAGNRARGDRRAAVVGQALAERDRATNRVRREVAEAAADARAAAGQIELARAAVSTAEAGYREEAARIRQSLSRPLELIDSFRQLLDGRLEQVRAVTAFDQAQFRLRVAVGGSPLDLP